MKKQIAIWALVLFGVQLSAQYQLTLEDAVLKGWSKLAPENKLMLQWVPGEEAYSYLSADYQSLVVEYVDGRTVKVSATAINDALEPNGTKIPGAYVLEWKDGNTVYFESDTQIYTYTLDGQLESHQKLESGAANVHVAPETMNAAYTVNNNVIVSWNGGISEPVTHFEDPNMVAGQAIARSEFGITEGLFWSPDGQSLAFYQKDESQVANYPLLDITQTPGVLQEIKYPMAGQGSERAKVGVFRQGMEAPVYLDTDGDEADQYLTNLSWSPDGTKIILAILNRAQNHFDVVLFDAVSGDKIKTLFSEDDEQWAEPEHPAYWISNEQFVWMSERSGFMNLYLYNIDGKLVRTLTKNAFVATGIKGRDQKGNVLFTATGADPRESHLFSVSLRGKQRQLTTESATHNTTVMDGGSYFVDHYQSVDVPRVIQLKNTSGSTEKQLLNASNPWEGSNIPTPELGSILGPDGSTLYTRMIKPIDFDLNKKYPVLVYVYGGPHAQMVTNSWNAGAPLWMNEFANRGYIVFTLDNRGSAHRGTAFEQQIHRQLGTVEMEDQLAGVNYLKSLPYVDGDRMAVHGWSYGGFMTTSLMLRQPGTFKAGVAGGPVTDWAYYEVMYGERYMDRPSENPEGYEANKLHNYVSNLQGDLLLIHGTVDDVVVMQHNLSLVKSFIDAGVQMDFFPYPMHPHNVRGKDRVHLMTKVLNYIEESLKD